jgi:hypothetical protein
VAVVVGNSVDGTQGSQVLWGGMACEACSGRREAAVAVKSHQLNVAQNNA